MKRLTSAASLMLLCGTAACNRSPDAAVAPMVSANSAAAVSDAVSTTRASRPTVAASGVGTNTVGPASDWNGRYLYEFGGGANTAGTAVTVAYTLTLTPSSCTFSAEGYQTDETIACTTKRDARAIDIAFRSYSDGGVTDRYGNAVYAVGDPLFSLENKNGTLITHWKGYALPDDKPHGPAVFFSMTRAEIGECQSAVGRSCSIRSPRR